MPPNNQPPRRIDAPEPCFLRMRLVKNGPYAGARIFLRLGVLAAEINGEPADVDRVWTSGERVAASVWAELNLNPPDDPLTPHNWVAMKPAF